MSYNDVLLVLMSIYSMDSIMLIDMLQLYARSNLLTTSPRKGGFFLGLFFLDFYLRLPDQSFRLILALSSRDSLN
jgi:hypothetical protein